MWSSTLICDTRGDIPAREWLRWDAGTPEPSRFKPNWVEKTATASLNPPACELHERRGCSGSWLWGCKVASSRRGFGQAVRTVGALVVPVQFAANLI